MADTITSLQIRAFCHDHERALQKYTVTLHVYIVTVATFSSGQSWTKYPSGGHLICMERTYKYNYKIKLIIIILVPPCYV